MNPCYLMFLNKSFPKVLSGWMPNFEFSSLSSGIMGGGGPIGFFSSVAGGERGMAVLLLLAVLLEELSLLRNRPNQPLDRFAFRESTTLLPLRLWGRPSWLVSSPLAYAVFNRPRLNRRRMLPGRFDSVGDAGPSSARLLEPAMETLDSWELGDAAFGLPLVVLVPSCGCCATFGVSGGVGAASSCIGEGSGGGMSVPSVKEPNLKSSAGSSNRLAGVGPEGAAVVLLVGGGIAGPERRVEIKVDRRAMARAIGLSSR